MSNQPVLILAHLSCDLRILSSLTWYPLASLADALSLPWQTTGFCIHVWPAKPYSVFGYLAKACALCTVSSGALSWNLGSKHQSVTFRGKKKGISLGTKITWLGSGHNWWRFVSNRMQTPFSCVKVMCDPLPKHNLHASWHFLNLESTLCYIIGSSHLNLTPPPLHCRYLKPLCVSAWG